MVNHRFAGVLRHLGRLVGRAESADLPDGQLLERFAAQRDQAAFEALVRRHGRLVLGTCQRVLQDRHAAEDAFQAVFLVLARKAGTLDRGRPLTSWLYTVAYRMALRARTTAVRRQECQEQAAMRLDSATCDPGAEATAQELRRLLDEELHRLPEKYRLPLVLCYLEEKSHEEAAQELGVPRGSMAKRLAGAQERLRRRLVGRGLALSGAALAALLGDSASAAVVSGSLVQTTVAGAIAFAAGPAAAGLVSVPVAAMAEGVLQTMFVTKLKILAAVGVMLGVAVGGSLFAYHSLAGAAEGGPSQPPVVVAKAEPPTKEKIAAALRALDSSKFEDREAASKFLIEADLAALPALRAALKEKQPLETTRRLENIIKAIGRPERMLKVQVEVPAAPVMLGVGPGTIPVKLWLHNTWDVPVVVCQPLDGSMHKARDPQYGFTLRNSLGLEMPRTKLDGCGNVNTLRAADLIRLNPGEKVDVINREGSFGGLWTSYFDKLTPGTYTLAARYQLMGTGNPGGMTGLTPPAAQELYKQALVCDLVSEPVKIEFVAAPPTEHLRTLIDQQDDRQIKLSDMIRVLESRSELPAFASLCKVLTHKDPQAREAAAAALRHYGDAGKGAALIQASRDENERVRGAAVSALAGVKEKPVIEALIARLADSDFQVRYAAITRLKEFTGETHGYSHLPPPEKSAAAIQKWQAWWQQNRDTFNFR